jgi:hypothetical protein
VAAADESFRVVEAFEPPPALPAAAVLPPMASGLGDDGAGDGRRSLSRWRRERTKMDGFEIDIESHRSSSFGTIEKMKWKKRKGWSFGWGWRRKEEGMRAKLKTADSGNELPIWARCMAGSVTMLLKCVLWCITMIFRTLARCFGCKN